MRKRLCSPGKNEAGPDLGGWFVRLMFYRPIRVVNAIACVAGLLCGLAPVARAALPDEARDAISHGLDGLVAEGSRPAGALMIVAIDATGESSKLKLVSADVFAVCAAHWKSFPNTTVLDEMTGQSVLRNMLITSEDLRKATHRDAFLRAAKGDALMLTTVAPGESQLRVTIDLYQQDGESASCVVAIEKTDAVRRYLGEPVPGTLTLHVPSDASAFADGSFLGIGDAALVRRLEPGTHSISVTQADYPPFAMSIKVLSEQQLELMVHEKDSSGAPFLALLSSAVVPGLGSVLYGRPQTKENARDAGEIIAFGGALVFYIAATMWLVDDQQSYDFLSTDGQDRYETTKTAELATAGVGYALNLIGSFLVGKEYADKNRELIGTVKSR